MDAAAETRAQGSKVVGRWADLLFIAACVTAAGVLLYLGSGLTFYGDEWSFIRATDPFALDWLWTPHNEHLSVVPKLIYATLLSAIGLGSYLPYLVVLLTLHLATVIAVYVYARRVTMAPVALAMSVLLLFLGSGAEDLLWAFQISFLAATASGSWALVALMREPRPQAAWPIAVLLVVAVMSAGVGLFFLASAAAVTIVMPSLRRTTWVIVPAASLYGAWYLLVAPPGVRPLAGMGATVEFLQVGAGNAMGQITGLGSAIGLVLAVLLVGAALVDVLTGRPARMGLIAGAAGLVSGFVIIGLSRAEGGLVLSAAPRYLYPAAVFISIALAGWMEKRDGPRPGERSGRLLVVGVFLVIALGWNLPRLDEIHGVLLRKSIETQAGIAVIRAFGGSPAIPGDRGLLLAAGHSVLPGAIELRALDERYGAPQALALGSAGAQTHGEVLDRVLMALTSDSLLLSHEVAGAPSRFMLQRVHGAEMSAVGTCVIATPLREEATIDLSGSAGSSLHLTSEGGGRFAASLSFAGRFGAEPVTVGSIQPGATVALEVPDIGERQPLDLRVHVPGGSSLRMCDVVSPAPPESLDIGSLIVRPASDQAFEPAEREVDLIYDVRAETLADGCVRYTATGDDPYVSSVVPDGYALRVVPSQGGAAQVFLRVDGVYTEEQSRRTTLEARPYEILMPNGSHPDGWGIRVDPPNGTDTVICLIPVDG